LGIISLMGILVRNVIIMIDYAEEIQVTDGLSVKEAILDSAKRRMRPIFLTSSAASMGVIPMVLCKSPLWMPMGSVIFWGTIITMFFILTIIPVLYWKTQKSKNQQ
ncbi:MAG: efflux RND transporter permease subunit, partial [Muribaculaceae bacterium]|nr:efflux RND transporter permease subunit [Muribaculaceae bacterium]